MSGLAGPHGFTVNEGKPGSKSAKDPAPAVEELPKVPLESALPPHTGFVGLPLEQPLPFPYLLQ